MKQKEGKKRLLLIGVLTLAVLAAVWLRGLLWPGEPAVYRFTIRAGEGGTIPAGLADLLDGDYPAGEVISIQARSMPGFQFDGWRSSNGGTFGDEKNSVTTFVMPKGETEVTAVYVPIREARSS